MQLYLHDMVASVTRPVKELKGFKRLALAPREQRHVTFDVAVSQLGFYNQEMAFVVEPGTIEVMVGSSSDDIRLSGQFEIVGDTERLPAWGASPCRVVVGAPRPLILESAS